MTSQPPALRCGAFRLDLASERLWKDTRPIEVTPKAWAVLRYLIERPGQLVTKTDLLDAVWGGVNVGDGSLTRVIFAAHRLWRHGTEVALHRDGLAVV